jgi:hypothetical protein
MPSKRRRDRRDRENNGGPSPAWIGSAVLLGMVAIGLVIVLIHAATSGKPGTPTAASPPGAPSGSTAQAGGAPPGGSPPATAPGAGQAGRPAGCATTGTDQTIPTSPPAGVTWSLTGGFAVPSSAADGPTLHGPGGVRYCYSHTPLGAVLAASNLGQGTGSPQEIQDASLKLSVVPNQYSAQVASTPAPPRDNRGSGQFAGFRMISYSPDQASIGLAASIPGQTDSYPLLTVAMQWYQGDWRAVPQPGPTVVVTGSSATSLAGFVPWAGVS